MSIQESIFRIFIAMLIGGVIGWERETSNRPAGLRTHMLVAIGAGIVMIMGEISLYRYADLTNMDPTRLGGQVITGIGFIGAGAILREGFTVRGLTTAASLWAVACLGLAAGGGFYPIAAAGTIATIITLTLFEYIEGKFKKEKGVVIEVTCEDVPDVLMFIKKRIKRFNATLGKIDVTEETVEEEKKLYHLALAVSTEKTRKKIDYSEMAADLASLAGVHSVDVKKY